MRDDTERVHDMLEAIKRIERYSGRGREAFRSDELIQTWVVHHLEVLGEAAAGVSAEFRSAHPQVPWPKIVGLRNVLVHGYFQVDLDAVWNAVKLLEELRRQLLAILSSQ